jgi:hypothetical protein
LHIRNIVTIVFAMITKLTEMGTKRQLIIAVGVAAIIVLGIGSHTAFAIKVSNTSFQDGYNAGFAAGKKDRKNGNEFDSKPPKGHSDAYDEGYTRGYDDGWSREDHVDSNSTAAASSSSSAAGGGEHNGHKHRHRDSAAASSSSSAAAGGDDGHHKDSAAASSSSSASS